MLYPQATTPGKTLVVLRHQLELPAVPFREFPVASPVDANDEVELRNHHPGTVTKGRAQSTSCLAGRVMRESNPLLAIIRG